MPIGCVLIPQFPAWTLRKHGADCPLAVISQGTVIAVDPEAKSSGVQQGMAVGRAETLCNGLSVYPRDRALESAEWERVEKALNATTPYVECDAPGRSCLDPHDRPKLQKVVRELGAQAALAPTRIDAWLAALKAVRGEMLEISDSDLRGFRRDIPVEDLVAVGVAEEVTERLRLFGYKTVSAVGDLSKKHLRAQFGEEGKRLYDRLNAERGSSVSVYTPPPTIEKGHRFERPRLEPGPITQVTESLVEEAIIELEERTTQRLTLELIHRNQDETVISRTLREPENRKHALCSTAETLLKEGLTEAAAVEEVKVVFAALANQKARQGNLFFERPAVQEAIRKVHQKYPESLQRAVLSQDAVFEEDQVRYEPATA